MKELDELFIRLGESDEDSFDVHKGGGTRRAIVELDE